jgi:hypothetical protein
MRVWKLVVLLAGVVGVIGFFTPLVEYHTPDGRLTNDASAFDIARGVDSGSDLRDQAEHMGFSPADSARLSRAVHAGIEAYASAVAASFIPAGALVALGLLLMLRDRMGRFAGLCAILLGVACAAVFASMWQADQATHDPGSSLGLGIYLLLAAGLGGALAGLGALISPDRGGAS